MASASYSERNEESLQNQSSSIQQGFLTSFGMTEKRSLHVLHLLPRLFDLRLDEQAKLGDAQAFAGYSSGF